MRSQGQRPREKGREGPDNSRWQLQHKGQARLVREEGGDRLITAPKDAHILMPRTDTYATS